MSILGIIASSKLGVPATAYESIASASGTGSSNTITFSSIPSTYTHLQIRATIRRVSGTAGIRLTFNGDSTTSYDYHVLSGNGTTAIAGGTASDSYIIYTGQAISTASTVSVAITDIHDYASTTKNKTVRSFNGFDTNGAGTVYLGSGLWRNTSAITTIGITTTANFATGTTFSLYGIKGA